MRGIIESNNLKIKKPASILHCIISYCSYKKTVIDYEIKEILHVKGLRGWNFITTKNVYNDYCYNNSLIINDSSIQKYDQNNFFGIFEINNNSPEENELEIEYLRKPVINYETSDVSMVIHGDHTKNLHKYGAPISSDVAVLMIRDGCDIEPSNCNILLSQCDNGWHPDLPLLRSRIKKRVTQMQFYSYRLQIRNGDWIQNTGRLYQ
ncbi:hypothetical protein RIR_jg14715.t1 [Rhizophagus irregularis DAOM 181602=DAOM 197198]|nr:hypothetical protein RIR_jg14715.t1 [Rhizophagus irregularis DAOM 181602=DAOM 197198]